LNGAAVKRLDMAESMNTEEDINDSMELDSEEEDIQEISGLPLQVDYVQESWIPQLSLEDKSEIETKIQTDNSNQIIMTVDKTVIRATMLQKLLENYLVSKEVVNAYGRRLQASYTRRLCKFFPTSFFERLFNPNGTYKQQETAKVNIINCKGYTATINIFEYQLLLIPVFIDKHWTLISADMMTRQVRFIDPAGSGGLPYLLVIRRWMRAEWTRFY
jgi:Ulp1 family protease